MALGGPPPNASSAGGPRPMEALRAKRRSTMTTRRQRRRRVRRPWRFAAHVLVGRGRRRAGGEARGGVTRHGAAARWQSLRAAGSSPRRQSVGRPAATSREGRPVGRDLADLPSVLRRIADDFDHEKGESLNRTTAWAFTNQLGTDASARARYPRRQRRPAHHRLRGVAVGGRAVRPDLLLVFPKLKVVTLSANKILGQLGQGVESRRRASPSTATRTASETRRCS